MKIRWYDHVSEEKLRRRTGPQILVEKIKIAQWKCYGHVLRMPDDRLPKQALNRRPEGRRRALMTFGDVLSLAKSKRITCIKTT